MESCQYKNIFVKKEKILLIKFNKKYFKNFYKFHTPRHLLHLLICSADPPLPHYHLYRLSQHLPMSLQLSFHLLLFHRYFIQSLQKALVSQNRVTKCQPMITHNSGIGKISLKAWDGEFRKKVGGERNGKT